jgi:hypothetical protein
MAKPWAVRNQETVPEVVRLTALGYSPRHIAEITKRDPHTIYMLMDTDEFKHALETIRREADKNVLEYRERLAVASESALDRIISMSEAENVQDNIKLSANKAIVEYSGRAAPSKREEGEYTFKFESATLDRITEAMRELMGEVVNVPAKVV